MIKGIIFDLDNCIFDTRSLGEHFLDAVIAPLADADMPEEEKAVIREILWTTSLEDIFKLYAVPAPVAEKMRIASREMGIPANCAIHTFGDESCIANLPAKKYLVTSGYKKLQQAKIDCLGIAPFFSEVIVDATDDLSGRKGKKKIFEGIFVANNWEPSEVLVVGDNPKSELGAAKELGAVAVQTVRPHVAPWDGADTHITSLCELQSFF